MLLPLEIPCSMRQWVHGSYVRITNHEHEKIWISISEYYVHIISVTWIRNGCTSWLEVWYLCEYGDICRSEMEVHFIFKCLCIYAFLRSLSHITSVLNTLCITYEESVILIQNEKNKNYKRLFRTILVQLAEIYHKFPISDMSETNMSASEFYFMHKILFCIQFIQYLCLCSRP